MVTYCCVKDCRNNSAEKKKVLSPCSSVTFHSFPSNRKSRSKWLKAIGRASWEPPSYARVCSIHFMETQIKRGDCQRTRLTEDAYPVNELPTTGNFDSSALAVCRICLITDVRMYSLQLAALKECFKSIVGLNKEIEGLPQLVCCVCANQLIKSYNLIQKSAIAKKTLLNIYTANGEVTEGLVKLVDRSRVGLRSRLGYHAVVPKTVLHLQYDEDLNKYTHQSKTEENVCRRSEEMFEFLPEMAEEKDAYKMEVNIDFEDDMDASCDLAPDTNVHNGEASPKNMEHLGDYKFEEDAEVASKLTVEMEEGIREKRPRKPRKKVTNLSKNADGLTPDEVELQQYFNVVILTLEQQIEERDRQKQSSAYRDALYKCEVCYKTYMHPNAFKMHLDNHDPNRGPAECPVCKLRFKSDVLARSHANRTHAKRFYCKACPKVFNYVRIAKIHQKRHEGYVYKCPFCEFSTLHESALGLHVRGHHPARHACPRCGQAFASERGLALHTQRTCPRQGEVETGGLHCKNCGTDFPTAETCRLHVCPSSPDDKQHGNGLIGQPHRPRCDERHPTPASTQRHISDQHTPRKLNWHMPGGQYPHHCEHCGEPVNNRKEHYMHIRKVHPKERGSYQPVITAVCDTCGKGFQNSTKLHLHELRHGGAGTVRCPHCPRLFYDKYQLARHVGVHSDARPYACRLCDKAFKLRSNLDRHAKVHSGVTPYECTMCGKRFRYSSSRNLHIRTVHYKMPHPPRKKRAAKRVDEYDSNCDGN